MKLYCAERGNFAGSPAVYALLRHAVEKDVGIPMPRVMKTAMGKPYFPDRPEIHFSLSHTSTHVFCAVSDSVVGADIEAARTVRKGVAERVCTPEELRDFDFFELWVLKESYIKLYGDTRVRLRDICFRRRGGGIVTPGADVGARLYSDIPGCLAAVCSQGGGFPDTIDMVGLSKIL